MVKLLGWILFVLGAACLYMAVVVIADGVLAAGTLGLCVGVVCLLVASRMAGLD